MNHTAKSNFSVARLKNNWKLGLNARSRNGRPLKWHIWKKRVGFRAENDPSADSFTPEALQPAFRGGLSTVLSSVEDRLASREQSHGGERVSVNKYASRYFNGGNNFRRAINQPLQPGTREWRTLRDSFFLRRAPSPAHGTPRETRVAGEPVLLFLTTNASGHSSRLGPREEQIEARQTNLREKNCRDSWAAFRASSVLNAVLHGADVFGNN